MFVPPLLYPENIIFKLLDITAKLYYRKTAPTYISDQQCLNVYFTASLPIIRIVIIVIVFADLLVKMLSHSFDLNFFKVDLPFLGLVFNLYFLFYDISFHVHCSFLHFNTFIL